MFTVSIAGASGYAGGELIRLVNSHPDLRLGALGAGAKAGVKVAEVHRGLASLGARVFEPTDASSLAEADIVALALPHGQSAALVAQLPPGLPVVDLGADFRLVSPSQWTRYYGGGPHAGTWAYGLPELPGQRARLSGQVRVANPGCYATAVALALAPLLQAGLAQPRDLVVVAASGTSGAGRKATESLLASEVMGAMSAYKVGGTHQHTPEMEQSLAAVAGAEVSLSFTPLLAPMPRGIVATCTALAKPGASAADAHRAFALAYQAEPFVQVLPEGVWPTTAGTLASNSVHLQVALDEHAGRFVVVSALDNLVKGAAGQAVQNINRILELPEGTGLPVDGVAP